VAKTVGITQHEVGGALNGLSDHEPLLAYHQQYLLLMSTLVCLMIANGWGGPAQQRAFKGRSKDTSWQVLRAGSSSLPLLCGVHVCRCSMRVWGCRKVVSRVQHRQLAQAYQMLHPPTSKQRSTGSEWEYDIWQQFLMEPPLVAGQEHVAAAAAPAVFGRLGMTQQLAYDSPRRHTNIVHACVSCAAPAVGT
jgi:hypothetical protein